MVADRHALGVEQRAALEAHLVRRAVEVDRRAGDLHEQAGCGKRDHCRARHAASLEQLAERQEEERDQRHDVAGSPAEAAVPVRVARVADEQRGGRGGKQRRLRGAAAGERREAAERDGEDRRVEEQPAPRAQEQTVQADGERRVEHLRPRLVEGEHVAEAEPVVQHDDRGGGGERQAEREDVARRAPRLELGAPVAQHDVGEERRRGQHRVERAHEEHRSDERAERRGARIRPPDDRRAHREEEEGEDDDVRKAVARRKPGLRRQEEERAEHCAVAPRVAERFRDRPQRCRGERPEQRPDERRPEDAQVLRVVDADAVAGERSKGIRSERVELLPSQARGAWSSESPIA